MNCVRENWISPSIPIIRDRTTTNLLLRNYWKSNSRSFLPPGHPAIGARSIKQLLDYSWTMPTPHGSYYKQLSELLDDQAQTSQVGVVCDTFSACISLVAKSDFLSILPEEMGCDPLHGQGLVMLPVSEILPKAAYYLIQRRDSRQTPLTAPLITQFLSMWLSAKLKLHKRVCRHPPDSTVHTAVHPRLKSGIVSCAGDCVITVLTFSCQFSSVTDFY